MQLRKLRDRLDVALHDAVDQAMKTGPQILGEFAKDELFRLWRRDLHADVRSLLKEFLAIAKDDLETRREKAARAAARRKK